MAISDSLAKEFEKKLDMFLAEKTGMAVDRATCLPCVLEDKTNKIEICFMFMRDWDATEYDDFTQTIIEPKGIVINLPAYWVCVPKALAMPYLMSYVHKFYSEYADKWIAASTGNNSTGGFVSGGSSTGCPACCTPTSTTPVYNPNFGGYL